jgi:Fe-S cluster assembly ATP-binding protein
VAFQYPIEIPGISVMNFLKASVNAHRQAQALPPLDAADLLEKTKEQLVHVGLTPDFLYRSLNSGFSGGEKKRCELLQLALLQPKVAILDETDSGLDLDAFKMMADCINKMRNKHRSFIIITHYEQLVATLQPDFLHIFKSGNITHTGGQQLLEQLINNGYKSFNDSKG